MKRKLIVMLGIIFSTLCCQPAKADSTWFWKYNGHKENIENQIENGTYTYTTKYARNDNVPIYANSDTDSEMLGCAYRNTSFEVIENNNGWSLVTTCDGYAFIETKYLSNIPMKDYSKDDLEVLAHVIRGEAGDTSGKQEELYVGSVVLNRVASKHYANTIKGVVFQKGQYACVWDGNYYKTPTKQNYESARYLLENGSILPQNVVYQAQFKQGKGVYVKTKYHYYCY